MKNIILLIAFLSSTSIYAQLEDKKSILKNYFDLLEEKNQTMGSLSISIGEDGYYNTSIGYQDAENKSYSTNFTKYRIGSITKTFTAVLFLKLAEQNKISLEDKLEEFYPNIPKADEITMEMLLKHRSGIFNFTNDPEFLTYMYSPQNEDFIVNKIAAYELDFEPGSAFNYSNSGFYLLSRILEKVSESSYSELLENIITTPLKLKNTYFGGKIGSQKNEAHSYIYMNDWTKRPESDMSIPYGAGSIVSTPVDLTVFYRSILNSNFLSDSSKDALLSTQDDFGLGIMSMPFNDKIGYGHGGTIDGFQSLACYFPKDDIAAVYTCNAEIYPVNTIMKDVLSILMKDNFEMPIFEDTAEIDESELLRFEGEYTSTEMPLDIKVFIENSRLMAQASGQSAFPLDYYGDNTFKFDAAGIKIVFKPTENSMIMTQGRDFLYTRKAK